MALEEEDVWRAVVNWAKFHAGVVQRTAHWTEEERARVCQHLSGVINHVRLLLIGKRGCFFYFFYTYTISVYHKRDTYNIVILPLLVLYFIATINNHLRVLCRADTEGPINTRLSFYHSTRPRFVNGIGFLIFLSAKIGK